MINESQHFAEQQHATPDEDDEIKLENNFTQLSRNLTISTKHAHPDHLLLTMPAHTVVLFEGSLQGQVWSVLKCRFQCASRTHNQQFCLSNFCFPSKFDSILQNLLRTLLLCCNTELEFYLWSVYLWVLPWEESKLIWFICRCWFSSILFVVIPKISIVFQSKFQVFNRNKSGIQGRWVCFYSMPDSTWSLNWFHRCWHVNTSPF